MQLKISAAAFAALAKDTAVDRLDATSRNPPTTGDDDGATGDPVTPRVHLVELRGTALDRVREETVVLPVSVQQRRGARRWRRGGAPP